MAGERRPQAKVSQDKPAAWEAAVAQQLKTAPLLHFRMTPKKAAETREHLTHW